MTYFIETTKRCLLVTLRQYFLGKDIIHISKYESENVWADESFVARWHIHTPLSLNESVPKSMQTRFDSPMIWDAFRRKIFFRFSISSFLRIIHIVFIRVFLNHVPSSVVALDNYFLGARGFKQTTVALVSSNQNWIEIEVETKWFRNWFFCFQCYFTSLIKQLVSNLNLIFLTSIFALIKSTFILPIYVSKLNITLSVRGNGFVKAPKYILWFSLSVENN